VKYWANRTVKWFKLKGFIILKSSLKNYHVVFNRAVSWKRNIHIMNWVALESHNEKMKDYALMQGIKESSTLRVSPKRMKRSPRIVYRYGMQEDQIRSFLCHRNMIKRIQRLCV